MKHAQLRSKGANTKHLHKRHPKQQVSKQSCSNIQLSSKLLNIGKKKSTLKNPNAISMYTEVISTIQTNDELCLKKQKTNTKTNKQKTPPSYTTACNQITIFNYYHTYNNNLNIPANCGITIITTCVTELTLGMSLTNIT